MGKWKGTQHRLPKTHGWKAKPGHKIFVADRGAVRFDFPADWEVIPGDDSICLYDRRPPDDDCLIQVSVMHLPAEVDWSRLPLEPLVRDIVENEERQVIETGEFMNVKRQDLELCWTQITFFATNESRNAYSRICLARGNNIQPLITMEMWPEHCEKYSPVWDEVLRSLQLGNYIRDPLHFRPV